MKKQEGSTTRSNTISRPQQPRALPVKEGYKLLCFSSKHYDTVAFKLFSPFYYFTVPRLAQEMFLEKKSPPVIAPDAFELRHSA